MIDIFDEKTDIILSDITCHSGGALGADSYWEGEGREYGVKTKAYSYKTTYHKSVNKVEITEEDYIEGITQIKQANLNLNRFGIERFMNLLARNWAQVKYSKQTFAIGEIIDPGKKGKRGYYSKSKYQSVDGGTGYAVQMSINNNRDTFVFDQVKNKWFRWSYTSLSFIELAEVPKITSQDFAGVGTREINQNGIDAIKNVYQRTFSK